MVLDFGKLRNDIGILQTKFRYREGHETRRVGLQAMPLDQHIEGRHGEREPRLNVLPHAVHDLLAQAISLRDPRDMPHPASSPTPRAVQALAARAAAPDKWR